MTRTPGRLATFIVRILFRQNAVSPGRARSSGSRAEQEERFRSALELVLLMDSALTAQK